MKATTIKFDGDILREIRANKPDKLSFTAFVKELIRKELQRRKLRGAAQRYAEFVGSNQEERGWLEEWESADLARTPEKRK